MTTTITELHSAQERLFALVASMSPADALALAAAHAEQARAAAPSAAGEQEAAAADEDSRIAARRYSTGGDWLAAVQSSLEHAQFAYAVAPAYLQDAAPAALAACRRQLAAAGDQEEVERERLADDLARWAGADAAAAQRETCDSDGCTCSNCTPRAREDAERNMYAFALGLPIEQLRSRHLSARLRDLAEIAPAPGWEQRAEDRAREEGVL